MVTRRSVLKGAVGASALALPVVHNRAAAFAQDSSPVPVGPPPIPEGCVLVAGGLLSPRFLAIADDGSIYVTEAGVGGDEELFMPAEGTPEATPAPQAPFAVRGQTGQVTKITADGTISVVASGISSYLIGGFTLNGPAGIVLSDGLIWVSVGGAGVATAMVDPIEHENSVISVDEATGVITVVADIGAFERSENPDLDLVDSNLYGMDIGADGLLYVADAGGNTVYRVDPATGELSLLAVIPDIEVPNELEPVPTGVAANPAGGVFVSLLSGAPFPAGAAKIQAISEDGTVTDAGAGLTMATDVAIGPDGHMYAVQLSSNFLAEIPEPGNVVRVLANGTLEPVVEGLTLPNGIAFDAAGNLFIAAGTVAPPGIDPIGMVLQCDGVASPA